MDCLFCIALPPWRSGFMPGLPATLRLPCCPWGLCPAWKEGFLIPALASACLAWVFPGSLHFLRQQVFGWALRCFFPAWVCPVRLLLCLLSVLCPDFCLPAACSGDLQVFLLLRWAVRWFRQVLLRYFVRLLLLHCFFLVLWDPCFLQRFFLWISFSAAAKYASSITSLTLKNRRLQQNGNDQKNH